MTIDVEKEIKLLKQQNTALSDQLAEVRQQIDKLAMLVAEIDAAAFLDNDDIKKELKALRDAYKRDAP